MVFNPCGYKEYMYFIFSLHNQKKWRDPFMSDGVKHSHSDSTNKSLIQSCAHLSNVVMFI